MMPKHVNIHGIFNNENVSDNSSDLWMFRKYQNDNNNLTDDHLMKPNESFLNRASPLILKRSSLIKYDDSYLLSDNNFDKNNKKEDIVVYAPENAIKSSSYFLPKTTSISSSKISSLTEKWPSCEYVHIDLSKAITKPKCEEFRYPLSIATSNGNMSNNTVLSDEQPTNKESSYLDAPLSFSSNKAELSSCLSKCDPVSKCAATDIVKLMNFTDMSLVESLQNFIRKIPVIGESQERDRILTYFSDRFMICNPNAFRNNDSCHTLVCAVMLLNTDIHGQVSKRRMTCKEFVDNILSNYPDNNYLENDLISIYNFIRKSELKNDEASDNTNTLLHKFSKLITKSMKPTQDTNTVKIDPNLLNQQRFISGNIMRKCIKRSFGKRPALGHRGWKLQFASLIGLQLLLFKTNLNQNDGSSDHNDYNGDRISLTDSNISSELLHNDDSSLCMSINNTPKSNFSKLPSSCSRENIPVSVDDVECCIKIHHGFAGVVEKLRHKNVFGLRLADQAEYFFKVKSDQLQSWINSINYAAAILSAPPIVGAGQCGLYKPLLPGYLTDLDKVKQMESHEDQIRHYRESLKKLELVDSKTRSANEPQIQFCKYEITRFESYLRLLRSQPTEECRSDQIIRRTDINSIFSIMEPQHSNSFKSMPQSPRSAVNPYHNYPDESSQDMTTLRRRPHKVPNVSFAATISRTASSPSNKIHGPSPLQMSPTTDSLHSCIMPRYYIPLPNKPMTYSPQIGSHFQFHQTSPSVRPVQSFSRFIEPSYSHSYRQSPQILSPLTPIRSQPYHNRQPSATPLPVNKLPKYSPPSSRHNISQI